MKDFAQALAIQAGRIMVAQLDPKIAVRTKGDLSNIVTAVDIASEMLIVQGIRGKFPDHSIIAEESGADLRNSEFTWVVDPLDGTSNFAAGIPWFGVLVALFRGGEPIVGVMYLPVSNELYVAERGKGAYCNGQQVRVAAEGDLAKVLWAYGMDASADEAKRPGQIGFLLSLSSSVRNVRMTNSLVDAAYTADGRLGGMVNFNTKIWDIAAPSLIVKEAGGAYTDLHGAPLRFDLSTEAYLSEYAVLAGARALHARVLELARSAL